MNRKPAHKEKNSLRLFILFCISVLLLITGSLCIKLYQSVRSSVYDQTHAFVLSVKTTNGIIFYNIVPGKEEVANLRLQLTETDPALLADTAVASSETSENTRLKKILPGLFVRGGKLTWFDVARLITKTSPMTEQTDNLEVVPKGKVNEIDPGIILTDPDIMDEGLSVGIVNATGMSGVGGRVEKELTALGVSVVSVTTGRKDEEHSQITYSGQESHTIKRLSRILKMPVHPVTETSASDILILLGKDSAAKGIY
jgi:hypothetical protein